MANRELLEWLGITFADLLIYLALAALVALFFISAPLADGLLAALAIGLTLAACPLGMKPDPALSSLTNGIKLVTYPLCVVLAVVTVVVHYGWFNN